MGLKNLAEGIIVQTMEDLWDDDLREDCIEFFKGEEFRLCAELADMSLDDQLKLLDMVKGVLNSRNPRKRNDGNSNSAGGKTHTRQKWSTKELAHCR